MDINIKDLASRYLVNHFVIGYFALYVILGDQFINYKLLKQIVLAIVASYLLFIPARLIVRIRWGRWEENQEAYTYYHFRIFAVLLSLTIIKFIDIMRGLWPWYKLILVWLLSFTADWLTWWLYRKDTTDC